MDWRRVLSHRATPLQVQSPEFKPQPHPTKKDTESKIKKFSVHITRDIRIGEKQYSRK
jgi:hypothetical protein